MNPYNEQYYILSLNHDEETLYLSPEMRSAMRHYEFTKLTAGDPMFFKNGYRDEDLAKGVKRPIKKGSSRISGERLSDFQKEVFGIPVAIAHSLQQFDFVVHPL